MHNTTHINLTGMFALEMCLWCFECSASEMWGIQYFVCKVLKKLGKVLKMWAVSHMSSISPSKFWQNLILCVQDCEQKRLQWCCVNEKTSRSGEPGASANWRWFSWSLWNGWERLSFSFSGCPSFTGHTWILRRNSRVHRCKRLILKPCLSS